MWLPFFLLGFSCIAQIKSCKHFPGGL
jgi:hypothetical protein